MRYKSHRMPNKEQIKYFVQKILGCGCPEEVFYSIECTYNVRLNEEIVLNSAITVGNRLLIYVLDIEPNGLTENNLAFVVSAGIRERDSRGLNRLRLVFVADEFRNGMPLINAFEALKDVDEKTHFHIISKEKSIFSA